MPKRDSPSSSAPRASSSSSSSSSSSPSVGHRSGRRRAEDGGDARGDHRPGDDDDCEDDEDAAAAAAARSSATDFDSSDPYAILGVPTDASMRQIKLSYRRLALMHHPDRQASQSDKDDAHRIFAAIGNAYEILSDEGRRREHDEGVRQQRRRARQGGGGMGSGSGCDPRGRHGFGYPAGHDPFAAFDHPFFSSSSSRSDFHFTDPFRLFEQFFAEEAGNRHGLGGGGRRRQGRDAQSSRTTPSADGTFFSPFSSSSVDHPFSDPFFSSGGMMGGGGGSPFGMMSAHFDGMNAMMSRMHHGMLMMGGGQSMMGGGNNATSNVGGRVSSSFGSSSASIRGGGSVSTSTRTTVINGVRKTVTERTVVHPDGRVERHVETTGDDGHDYLGGRLPSTSSDQHRALEYNGGGGSRRRHW